jgi:dephospho-CoA kinase
MNWRASSLPTKPTGKNSKPSCTRASAKAGWRNWSAEQIRQRIAAQLPVEQKNRAFALCVLWTEGALASHGRQVERVLGRI